MGDSMFVDKSRFISVTSAFVASILLLLGLYHFVDRVLFLAQSTFSSAPIVSVSHEYAPKGRGAVLAYVPTVQVVDDGGKPYKLKVDTFNEEPIYILGNEIEVICNPRFGCIEDEFLSKWGRPLFVFLLSLFPLLAWKLGLWESNDEMVGLGLDRDA
jgi:hypothetical protein